MPDSVSGSVSGSVRGPVPALPGSVLGAVGEAASPSRNGSKLKIKTTSNFQPSWTCMRIRCKPYTLHTFELINASKLFEMYRIFDV